MQKPLSGMILQYGLPTIFVVMGLGAGSGGAQQAGAQTITDVMYRHLVFCRVGSRLKENLAFGFTRPGNQVRVGHR
jgi:hypothetical protein